MRPSLVGEYGGGSEPVLKNCLITQNRDDGVVLRASSAAFERCTISRNGGWGIRGEYLRLSFSFFVHNLG
jgi:hypothetical protein